MSETIVTRLEQEAASSTLQTYPSSKNEGDYQNARVMGKPQILSALSACPLESEGLNSDSHGIKPVFDLADKTLEADKACPPKSLPHVFEWDEAKAGAVNLEQASAFFSLFVWPGEEVWVQTFQDGPTSLYLEDTFTRKDGSSGSKFKYKISKNGKTTRSDVTTWGSVALEGFQPGTEFAQSATRDSLARVGVSWTVNALEPGTEARSADRVSRIRAVFIDLDGAPLPASFPLLATSIVESSPGRFHVYWAVSDVPLEDFTPIQKYLAQHFGSDPVVCDLARVMRLPGFWHGKKEPGFLSHVLEKNPGAQYTRADLVGAFDGLEAALEQAQQQTKARLEAAELSRKRALELREELQSADFSDRAAVLNKYAQAALWDEVGKLSSTEQGGRNAQLFKSAAALGALVGAGILERGEAALELETAARAVGLDEREVRSTLENGLRAGEKNPRDLSNVAQLVGQKQGKTDKKDKAQKVKAPRPETPPVALEPEREGRLPAVKEIPFPEYPVSEEQSDYSDRQVLELLGKGQWGTAAATTNLAQAHRLLEAEGQNMAYTLELGWAVWTGAYWERSELEAVKKAHVLSRIVTGESAVLFALERKLDNAGEQFWAQSSAMSRAAWKHLKSARAIEGHASLTATLKTGAPLFAVDRERFELRPWNIGFQNGVWIRGVFREHRREDYMLSLSPVEHDPSFDLSVWLGVLERITGGDSDLALTLQDVAGYVLSGASTLRVLPWFYGPKGTGKSTFTELLCTVLGGMAANVDTKYFSSDSARERLGAVVWGKRVVVCSEAGNSRLDPELLKTLSGGDSLPVRFLYKEAFMAEPRHVLLMVANDAPRMNAYDEALKDRVLTLPFVHPLQGKPGDAPLLGGERIEAARRDPSSALVRGFTVWAVSGLARVLEHQKIHRARVITQASEQFWKDVDPISEFWEWMDDEHPLELTMGLEKGELRSHYDRWCEREGSRPLNAQNWKQACESHGLREERRGKDRTRFWVLERLPTLEADTACPPEKSCPPNLKLENLVPDSKMLEGQGGQADTADKIQGNLKTFAFQETGAKEDDAGYV